MSNMYGLPERTIKELLEYFQSNSAVEKVVLYGSRAKGTYHNGSDIDFALWFKEPANLSKISDELDELPTPYKFDVTDYKMLTHIELKQNIDSEGVIFYQRQQKI